MDEPSSHTGTYQSVHTAPPSTHSISYPQIPQTPLQAPLSLGTPHASAQSYYHPLPFPHSTPGHPYSHMQHYMHIPPHPPPPSPSTHHTSVGHHQSVFPLRPSTSVNVPPSTSSHHVDSVAQGTTRGPASRRGRKRKTPGGESENAQGPRASARRRVEDSATNSPPVTVSSANPSSSPPVSAPICGIGPSSGTSPPSSSTDNAGNSTERIKRDATTADATDVWYFMRALHTDVRPAEEPTGEPILTQNPGTPFIGCKLCPLNGWKVWNHGPKSSMTTCYRRHLKDKHPHTYKVTCKSLGLKYSLDEESESSKRDYTRVPFTMEMFYHLLMKWIVVDDQSFNVTDCDEFRDLLLYLGQGNIHEEDLPHRKMMTQKVLAEFKAEHEKLRQQMKDSLGRISFTTDLWSDPNLDSYMAVTAHFIIRNENGRLESRSALIAFRHIEGSHSGENLAAEFFRVLDEYEILGKIGLITMDNASNNGTLMEHLESALRERDIPFHRDGNRVRCFPHVINIACQAVIAALKDPTPSNLDWITSTPYQEALEKDLVGKVRAVVSSCRVSGQRRQMVQSIIQEGNEKGFWKDLPEEFNGRMPQWQLLRDCDTRWSSTYNMIDRFLFLWPAVHTFLIRSDLQSHVLSDFDIGVLKDIQKVLQVPHLAQELLSAERTPNLTLALPTYELLIKKWKLVAEKRPNLRSFVEIGINKLEEYVRLCRRSRIYAHAMVVDPLSKFSWITETWRPNEVKEAREWIKESMLIYQQHLRRTQATTTLSRLNPVSRTQSAPQVASSSLRRGYNRLASFDIESDLEDDTVTQPSQSNNARSTSTPPTSIQSNPEPLRQSDEEEAALQLAEDKLVVERELRAYEEATAPPYPDGQAPDPLWFWEVNRPSYPLLFQVAMDVLPAQASAVSCERVFSSSKETCTLRRSCLSPSVLEALQVLKYSFKQERLTFTSDLLAKVEDYNIDGEVTPYAINELMKQGKYDELNELISSSVSGNATTSTVAPRCLETHELNATRTVRFASVQPGTALGTVDGTPAGFLNADKIERMHPSDSRMSSWGPVTFTVGSSSVGSFPMAQFKDVNNPTTLKWTASSSQIGARTLRIRTTEAFAGGRPQITVNSWTSSAPAAPTEVDSRGVTRGTWRGLNQVYDFAIPSGTLVAGSNTITINVISGSSGDDFLSPNIVYDSVELF